MSNQGFQVRVMNSYDYGHFEVVIGYDVVPSNEDIDEARKAAQRLVIKAIEQYKILKDVQSKRYRIDAERERLVREVKIIRQNYPPSAWTPEQMAKVKALEDGNWERYRYDFQDDYDNEW